MGRHVLERRRSLATKNPLASQVRPQRLLYPLSTHKSCSLLSLSSLSLSQNSNASSLNSSISSWDPKINHGGPAVSLRTLFGSSSDFFSQEVFDKLEALQLRDDVDDVADSATSTHKRCNWITKFSDEAYVSFHDECWGVPIYKDNLLFELLSLCGMLIDHSWTEILKRRELYRQAFAGFDHVRVAEMEEKDMVEISSNKELMLAECRVRCIVDNAKCIQKVAMEFGSFSAYVWGHVNHKPLINKYKYWRSVPLRTPKSESVSKDLVRRGFRLVGPVIVYSFMQAAGLTIDHLVDCFRFSECVRQIVRPRFNIISPRH